MRQEGSSERQADRPLEMPLEELARRPHVDDERAVANGRRAGSAARGGLGIGGTPCALMRFIRAKYAGGSGWSASTARTNSCLVIDLRTPSSFGRS